VPQPQKFRASYGEDHRKFQTIQRNESCEIQASQDFFDDLIWRLADVEANRVTRFFQSCELAGQQSFAGKVPLTLVQTLGD
jgi:hypothetical protein